MEHPAKLGTYGETSAYTADETAIGPNGDIYVADGYGFPQFNYQYDAQRSIHPESLAGTASCNLINSSRHMGVALDYRDAAILPCFVVQRGNQGIPSSGLPLMGSTRGYYLPGAFVSRPVLDGENIYQESALGITEGNY